MPKKKSNGKKIALGVATGIFGVLTAVGIGLFVASGFGAPIGLMMATAATLTVAGKAVAAGTAVSFVATAITGTAYASEQNTEIQQLEDEVASAKELTRQKNELKAEISELSKTIDNQNKEAQTRERQLTMANRRNANLTNQVADLNRTIQTNNMNNDGLDEEDEVGANHDASGYPNHSSAMNFLVSQNARRTETDETSHSASAAI